MSNLFDWRAKCTNFNLVGGQIEMPKAREEGNGKGCPPPQPTRGSGVRGRAPAENEFWRILELEKTHLTDTNLSFSIFLGDLAGRIETPGGPDCGPRAICWTLLV